MRGPCAVRILHGVEALTVFFGVATAEGRWESRGLYNDVVRIRPGFRVLEVRGFRVS